jgi:D-glycero-D-manno-heptose 1,7-bisphosphate phosphatase
MHHRHDGSGMAFRLIILGRDGILNRYREDHVKAPEEWQPIPGALEAVAKLNQAGWHTVVATNQAGIGRGLVDMASVNAVHAHMCREVIKHGGRIDAVFFCPHVPEEGCTCRKPLPGMMHDVALRYGVELTQVPMVCDTLRDLQAAAAAGCLPHLVRTGRAAAWSQAQEQEARAAVPSLHMHDDLAAFARDLLAAAPGAPRSAPAQPAASPSNP